MSEKQTPSMISAIFTWYMQTSKAVGAPVVLVLILVFAQKFFFTGTCYTAGFRCEEAFGASNAMVEYMAELVGSNSDMDIVASPRKK